METTRMLELLQIFLIYSVTILGLGEIISRPFTRGKGVSYRLLVNLTVGNFYIINMTFVLAYLKIFYRFVLIVVFIAGAILLRFLLDRERMITYWKGKFEVLHRILNGEYGHRNAAKIASQKVQSHIALRFKQLFKERGLEFALVVIALGIHIYYYSYQAINIVSYASPDVEVHLYWIQSLVGGELFPAGVYPFGMHCIGAALSLIYGISAVTFARMFGVVTSFYIMLVCYILAKSICKQKYAPILGFFIFTIGPFFVYQTYMRYSAMISQEYAMVFLCPMMFFLYRYLNEKKLQDLIFFGGCVSLTLAIHFYITAIALFFCLAVGLVYIVRLVKRKMLGPLLLCGVTSIGIALLPLIIGLFLGYPLEQSFNYGASVLLNDGSLYGDEVDEIIEEEYEGAYGYLVDKPYTWADVRDTSKEFLEQFTFTEIKYLALFVIPLLAVFLNWMIRVIKKKVTDRTLVYLSLAVYTLIIFVQTIGSIFEIPIIIEPKRMSIFLAYMTPIVIVMFLDIFYDLIVKGKKSQTVWNAGILTCLCGFVGYACATGYVRPLANCYYFQTKTAMEAACDIIKNYEKDSWTIVSPVNETSVTYNAGFHYELVDFLNTLEDYEEGDEFYLPTEYVFFFVEKMPIENYGWDFSVTDKIFYEREKISMEDAVAEYESHYQDTADYYRTERLKVMSRAYYWAEAYRQYFPDEMKIFYETDEMVVYRLKQNPYALNNLAINYREGLLNEQE